MSITIKCRKCGKELTLPDSVAGNKVQCRCGQVMLIPEPMPAYRTGHDAHGHRRGGSNSDAWRVILFAGTLVVAVVALIIIFSSGGGKKPTVADDSAQAESAEAAAPAEQSKPAPAPRRPVSLLNPLQFVPTGVTAVGVADLAQLDEAALLDRLIGPELASMIEAAKLVPSKHLAKAAIAVHADGCALIVTGVFNHPSAIYNPLSAGVKPEVYQDCKLAKLPQGETISVIDNKLLVIGTEAMVKAVIDIMKSGDKPLGDDSPILGRVKDVRNDSFWFTAHLPPAEDAESVPRVVADVMSFTVGAKATKEACKFSATFVCKNPSAAALLQKQFSDTLPALATALAGQNQTVADIFAELAKGAKTQATQSVMTAEATLAPEQVDKLKTTADQIVQIEKTTAPPGDGGKPIAPPTLDNTPPEPEDFRPLDR